MYNLLFAFTYKTSLVDRAVNCRGVQMTIVNPEANYGEI